MEEASSNMRKTNSMSRLFKAYRCKHGGQAHIMVLSL
jgi:hypothetical protein